MTKERVSEALATLVCRAGLAVAHLDESGRLSLLSPALEQLLHRPFEVVTADELAEHFHLYTSDGDRLLRPLEVPIVRAWHGEVVTDATVTVRPPGQPVRHLCVHAAPDPTSGGEPGGAWAVMTDVTSRVASQRGQLSRSLAETVNHHLRTPLTVILGHAELLHEQRTDLPPAAAPSVEAVWRASQRLDDVVSRISEWIDLAFAPGQP